ncbi:MAG TPA: hypothetical protein VGO90_14100 [Chthoniobacteraceae bacterium]|jgi:hypothetical protein|nr:hypothetical protein [Chthoniobacteraceae bacterium]
MRLQLAWLLLATPSLCALDFRYSKITEIGEGGPQQYLQFADGHNAVSYVPPKAWEYLGASDRLRLLPTHVSEANIDISVRKLSTPLRVDEDELSTFEQLTRESLPQGAEKVELISAEPAPDMDGKPTIEFMLDYSFFGGRYRASFRYLTRGNDLVRFHVSCKAENFPALRKTFHASLHTFTGMANHSDGASPQLFRSSVLLR